MMLNALKSVLPKGRSAATTRSVSGLLEGYGDHVFKGAVAESYLSKQGLAAGTATIATAATAEGPPGGFKAKPVEQPTSKVNINTSQAPAYMDCPGMYGMRRGIFDATPST